MMISETHIDLANKFYRARKAMKSLLGDKYEQKVEDNRKIIEKLQGILRCDVFDATMFCIEKVTEKFPYNCGDSIAMLLATCVEMLEPENENEQ